MRTGKPWTFVPRSLNCTFRLLKPEQKSGFEERRTPGWEEIETDVYGYWEPVVNRMMEDPFGRLINITREVHAQFNEFDTAFLPEINDRVRMTAPSDASGWLYTIRSCERLSEHHYELQMEKYKD
jgi:hypothetical protein